MPDQAEQLRTLVQIASKEESAHADTKVVMITGGRKEVGVTELSVELAIALGNQGKKVLLVDANLKEPSIANRLNITAISNTEEILSGRKTLLESVVPCRTNVTLLAGAKRNINEKLNVTNRNRLLHQLHKARSIAEVVIVDAGEGTEPLTKHLWKSASLALLVTTDEADAVLDAYAAVKLALHDGPLAKTAVVANCTRVDNSADEIQHGIISACKKFLSFSIEAAPMHEDDALASFVFQQLGFGAEDGLQKEKNAA